MGGTHRNGIAHRTLKAQQTLRALEQVRGSLANFAKVMRRGRFELAPLHRHLIATLEGVESGKYDRVMVFMPPRHGKSLLSPEMMPAWYLGRHPDRSIIAVSYSAELATDFGRRVRNMMIDPIYRTIFPRALVSPDSSAAYRFNLMTGGAYYAVGAGGPLTGRGAELLIIDDPLKSRAEADSDAFRKQLHAWYESVAYTPLQPGGAIVLIQTRWHEDDLAGWLLREHVQENWQVVSLPAIAEADDPLGRREGAPLWPSHFSLERLGRTRQAIGGAEWASQYQQRPAAAEGAIFKRQWWQYWSDATLPPHFEQLVVSLDTAFKATNSSDYSVALVVATARTGYYVLDIWRERAEFPALKRAIEMLVTKWDPDRVLIEDKASGQSLIQELKSISRAPIFPIKVDSDKVSRANAATPMVEAGKVFLPRSASWLIEFVDELSGFPHHLHDDQVDSLTQALNFLRRGRGGPGPLYEYYRQREERETVAQHAPRPAQPAANSGAPLDIPPRTAEDECNADMWWKGEPNQPPPPGYQIVRTPGSPIQLQWVGRQAAPGLEWQERQTESVDVIGRQQTYGMLDQMRGLPDAIRSRFPARLDPRRPAGFDMSDGGGRLRELYERARERYFGKD